MARATRYLPLTLVGILLALLALLATLQYRWIGQVSRVERERMQANLSSAATRFAEDFDRELGRAYLTFTAFPSSTETSDPQVRDDLAERARLWTDVTLHPQLVADVYLAEEDDSGRLELERLDRQTERFSPIDWPAELRRLREHLEERRREAPPGPGPRSSLQLAPIAAEVPALVVPLGLPREAPPPDRPPRLPRTELNEFVILRLDLDYIVDELFPELASRYFAVSDRLDYDLAVVSSAEPATLVYQSEPALTRGDFLTPDATAELLALGRRRDFRGLGLEMPSALRRLLGGKQRQMPADAPPPPPGRFFGRLSPPAPMEDVGAHWQLLVRHRAGSLEAAVRSARRRNIAISLGILSLLAASGVMLIVTTQRAQQLARQKIDFVAGVSHELRTPLAVIRSAGENLAHGTVEDKEQVRRYGSLIDREGCRLSELVDQILTFAGAQSNRRTFTLRDVSVDTVIDGAIADCQMFLQDNGIQIERHVAADLPPVKADAPALRRAIHNLLVNAIKYGGRGGWIGVRARQTPGSRKAEVCIVVEDRGPGIAGSDLPHLFEPFYRGQEASAVQPHGSGLGLALVRHIVEGHGGRVTAKNNRDGGARFTIHIPVATTAEQTPAGEEVRDEARDDR